MLLLTVFNRNENLSQKHGNMKEWNSDILLLGELQEAVPGCTFQWTLSTHPLNLQVALLCTRPQREKDVHVPNQALMGLHAAC